MLNSKNKLFTVSETNAVKGVALLLLLWHHLFYHHPEYGYLSYELAQYAKVCVGIFVILSGYGLTESIGIKKIGLFSFYKKRLTKIYLTYWLIIAIFVPLGIFFMDRTLLDVFGDHAYLKFIVQILGFHIFIPQVGYGYNITWWFMTLIITLYLLFPFIYFFIKRFGLLFLLFTSIFLFIPRIPYIGFLQNWVFIFSFGVYLSQKNTLNILLERLRQIGLLRFIILLLSIIIVGIYRKNGVFLHGTRIDWLFGILIILLTVEVTHIFPLWKKVLVFIGIHSFNIFLFHTFLYLYYVPNFIYYTDMPIVIFISLLSSTLLISILIEKVKKWLLFDNLYQYIIRIKINDKIVI